MKWTIRGLRDEITAGRKTRTDIVEWAVERALDPNGCGAAVFTKVYTDEARRLARAYDTGTKLSSGELSGLPISIKDLFDVAGEVTLAGSKALEGAAPAKSDAFAVTRLKEAGAIILGRTNMTEFAFSGVGINPHFGTPPNPFDRKLERIPGGSSSGAAVSVSDEMSIAALGSDTGGSVRIPAALCGLTGYKPTQGRIGGGGMFPLSPTLDSVGVIAPSVACCHTVVSALMADKEEALAMLPPSGRTFVVLEGYFTDQMDRSVAASFDRALSMLSRSGARLVSVQIPELRVLQEVNARGGITAAEAIRFHRRLGLDLANYDPRVRKRVDSGRVVTDEDYADMLEQRKACIASFAELDLYDGLLCPTVPIVAPQISSLGEDTEFFRVNQLLLRNPSVANFLDLCAISLPCQLNGDEPAGLMLMGHSGADQNLLSAAFGIEAVLKKRGETTLFGAELN